MKQMRNVKKEIALLIRDVCMKLTGHADDNEVELLLGMAAAESSLTHRVQIGGGPARGLWQMEPATALDIFQNYLQYKPILYERLCAIWLNLSLEQLIHPSTEEMEYHLEHYDDFAFVMARSHILRDPQPIPDTVEGQAAYWKRVYNTPAGKGTVEHYLAQWEACGCEELLAGSEWTVKDW